MYMLRLEHESTVNFHYTCFTLYSPKHILLFLLMDLQSICKNILELLLDFVVFWELHMMGFEEVIGWEYSYGQVGINYNI